jgi:hypothetical protein
MSSITAATSALLTSPTFHGHGHRRGAHATSGSSSSTSASSSAGGSSIGQLPVGASTSLFGGLVQSFEQAIGSISSSVTGAGSTASTTGQAAASGASGSTTAATPGQGQELQAFQHSLLQALKQDGLGSNGTGNIVSSLQALIQQVGPNGKPTAATETLTSTFQNLVSGVSGGAAAAGPAGSGSNQSPNSGLQTFLNNLLQNVQAGGVQSLSAAGANVNTHV